MECHAADGSIQPSDPEFTRAQGTTFLFSRCFTAGKDRFGCTTCHDPHRALDTVSSHYEVKCLSCHSGKATPEETPRARTAAEHSDSHVRACPVNPKEGAFPAICPRSRTRHAARGSPTIISACTAILLDLDPPGRHAEQDGAWASELSILPGRGRSAIIERSFGRVPSRSTILSGVPRYSWENSRTGGTAAESRKAGPQTPRGSIRRKRRRAKAIRLSIAMILAWWRTVWAVTTASIDTRFFDWAEGCESVRCRQVRCSTRAARAPVGRTAGIRRGPLLQAWEALAHNGRGKPSRQSIWPASSGMTPNGSIAWRPSITPSRPVQSGGAGARASIPRAD